MRIISTVPSQTELLYHLGLEEEVVGITKFCIHPNEWFRNKKRIGGTKNLHLDEIKNLQPDLIIANKEENLKTEIEELAKDFNVYVSDVNDLADALEMIREVGKLTDKKEEAEKIVIEINNEFNVLSQQAFPNKKATYLIWNDPIMTIGNDTFINDMMRRNNWLNSFNHLTRYPEISMMDLENAQLDLLLLSTEPYPFKEEHKLFFEERLKNVEVQIVDGEFFSWYGSRLIKAPEYFAKLQRAINQ